MHTIPPKETMAFIADLFKGFADPTRVHILSLLQERELCVTEIAEAVELSQSAISHQLRILKAYNLVIGRKQGKVVYYTLADSHVIALLNTGLEHVNE